MSESLVVVEDADKDLVSYFPPGGWDDRHGAGFEMFHGSSYHVTDFAGGYVQFAFTGSFVAYYSDLNADHDNYLVSVDGAAVETASSYAPTWTNGSRLLFATPLSAGPHTLTVTNVKAGSWMGLDYFMYLPASVPQPRMSSTTAPAPTSRVPSTTTASSETSAAESTFTSTGRGLPPQSGPTPTGLSNSSAATQSADNARLPPSLPTGLPSRNARSGLSSTALHAVIGVACAVLIGGAVLLVVFLMRRRKQRAVAQPSQQPPDYSPPAYSLAESISTASTTGLYTDDRAVSQGTRSSISDSRARLSAKSDRRETARSDMINLA